MEKIQVNGVELAYMRRGEGKPLMLLHGYPLDHHIWDLVMQLLEDKFDLIIPDLCGFGESSTVDTVYTMDDFASDLSGLLDHLGISKVTIAGHSMGGYVALAFANNHPDLVSGLGMVSSQVAADPPDRKEGRYKTASNIAENGIQNVVETMTPKFTPNEEIREIVRQVIARQQPAALIGALKAMAERKDSSALFSSFKIPVVIIHGDADELISIDRAQEMKVAFPSAQFTELEAVGHLPMLEAPQETAKALLTLG